MQSRILLSGHDDQRLIPSTILKAALDKCLQPLGRATRESLFEDLERAGIYLDDKNTSYSIATLDKYLRSLVGADAAELILEELRKELRELDEDL